MSFLPHAKAVGLVDKNLDTTKLGLILINCDIYIVKVNIKLNLRKILFENSFPQFFKRK